VRAITEIGTVEIQRSQQELWRSGRLAPAWAHRFPELFDEDDLRLAQAQGHLGYHFCEWLAAIVLHHATGHLALVSKYEFRNHPRKQEVVQRLLAPGLRAAISDRYEAGLRPVVPGCLEALAAVALVDEAATAARLLGAAATFREILGAVPFRADLARCERTLAAASEALDAEAFAVAHGRGRAMGWREAVELALSVGSGDSKEAATPRRAPG
jgi:hypothetical protein